jgi:hypothetical protein
MLNPWFAITFHAARLGFEAQHAVAVHLMRLVGDASKTDAGGTIADEIAAPPQAVATKVASGGGRGRESVIKVHKKRSRSNKRKRSKINKRYSLNNSAPRTA